MPSKKPLLLVEGQASGLQPGDVVGIATGAKLDFDDDDGLQIGGVSVNAKGFLAKLGCDSDEFSNDDGGDSLRSTLQSFNGNQSVNNKKFARCCRNNDFQEDILGIQVDATLDPDTSPGTPSKKRDRYIITDAGNLHANFGSINNLEDNDIVYFTSGIWKVAYDVSVQGEGALVWNQADDNFYKWDGVTWSILSSSEALDDLSDVVLTSPANNEYLCYNGTNWVNSTIAGGGATALDDLTDATITAAATGEFLRFNGTAWVDSVIQTADITSAMVTQHAGDIDLADLGTKNLPNLDDVTLTSPANGEVLKYNGTIWVNAVESGGASTLDALTDTTLSSPANGEVLKYNGSAWINAADTDTDTDNLADLTDTTITAGADGDFLRHNGSVWVDSTIQSTDITSGMVTQHAGDIDLADLGTKTLPNLTDVTLTTPANGEVLKFNGTIWVNAADTDTDTDNLVDLTDTVITTPANGEVLKYNGTNWINAAESGGGASALDDLTDATITSPANGEVLKYNGSAWVNAADADTDTDNLADLTDTIITAAASGDFLRHNGTAWVDATIADGDIASSAVTQHAGDINLSDLGTKNLPNLGDVTLTSPANGEVLKYNGSIWVNAADADTDTDNLNDLTDTTLTTPANGEVLKYNGSIWVNAADTDTDNLSDLTDTTLTSPANGEVLKYNGSAWVNAADTDTDTDNLADLTDTTITAGADGDFLRHNGSVWVDATIADGDIASSAVTQHAGSINLSDLGTKILPDLTDVTVTTPANGEVLKYNGTIWVNAADTDTDTDNLADLTDTTLTSPANGEVLKYNGSAWVNAADTDTDTDNLADLTDTTITSPASLDVLNYSGSEWVNTPIRTITGTDSAIAAEDITAGDALTFDFDGTVSEVKPFNFGADSSSPVQDIMGAGVAAGAKFRSHTIDATHELISYIVGSGGGDLTVRVVEHDGTNIVTLGTPLALLDDLGAQLNVWVMGDQQFCNLAANRVFMAFSGSVNNMKTLCAVLTISGTTVTSGPVGKFTDASVAVGDAAAGHAAVGNVVADPTTTDRGVLAFQHGPSARSAFGTKDAKYCVFFANTHASGTITFAGDPVDGETLDVNGTVYTCLDTPVVGTDFQRTAGNNNAMASALAAAINTNDSANIHVLANAAVVELTAKATLAATGNAIVLTEAMTNVSVSGAGTLTGGVDDLPSRGPLLGLNLGSQLYGFDTFNNSLPGIVQADIDSPVARYVSFLMQDGGLYNCFSVSHVGFNALTTTLTSSTAGTGLMSGKMTNAQKVSASVGDRGGLLISGRSFTSPSRGVYRAIVSGSDLKSLAVMEFASAWEGETTPNTILYLKNVSKLPPIPWQSWSVTPCASNFGPDLIYFSWFGAASLASISTQFGASFPNQSFSAFASKVGGKWSWGPIGCIGELAGTTNGPDNHSQPNYMFPTDSSTLGIWMVYRADKVMGGLAKVRSKQMGIGVALTTATAGNSVDYALPGEIIDGAHGTLVPGQRYYIKTDGGITDVANGKLAGVAVSTTALKIDPQLSAVIGEYEGGW